MNENELIPAIPPDDYRGSVSEWLIKLQERGLWDGEDWYGDVMLTQKQYDDILTECEHDVNGK